jgi:hypothetical protein
MTEQSTTRDVVAHYSGFSSRPFWDRVSALPEMEKEVPYALGVALQNLEAFVLQQLANAERRSAPKQRSKRRSRSPLGG